MASRSKYLSHFIAFSLLLLLLANSSHAFEFKEATIDEIQKAFAHGSLTSLQLVQHYKAEISRRNGTLFAVIELNPDAETLAQQADQDRPPGQQGRTKLAGIPILLKDNMGTDDKMNTTAGSYALLGSKVSRDAFAVQKLRTAGAIILGKASLSQWSGFRSLPPRMPLGWSSRGGQGKNPYNLNGEVCGSSSGSAISVSANLVTVALGTETDGSIICPSGYNSVVGIKPTVNLTSRAGVIPISLRQDTVGTMARTVTDAVYVLDIIVGRDDNDPGTINGATHIPVTGYAHYVTPSGIVGKRLGILRNADSFNFTSGSIENITYEQHFQTLSENCTTIVDNLVLDGDPYLKPEITAMLAEFKRDINSYLAKLEYSPVKNLEDIIKFNDKEELEKVKKYGQDLLLEAQATNGINETVQQAISQLESLSKNEFEKLMKDHRLDALMFSSNAWVPFLAVGGFPIITVPAGYDKEKKPFGLCFAGRRHQEPSLIEIAYAFELATKKRQPPPDDLQVLEESEGTKLIAQS